MTDARWQMLPGGLLEEPGAKRSARDWIVDATMLVLALAVGAIALGSTEKQRSEWMAFVDLLVEVRDQALTSAAG
jgi:hypothetical protein